MALAAVVLLVPFRILLVPTPVMVPGNGRERLRVGVEWQFALERRVVRPVHPLYRPVVTLLRARPLRVVGAVPPALVRVLLTRPPAPEPFPQRLRATQQVNKEKIKQVMQVV